ncbi:Tripeptidyl-peptidase 2 [Vitis vinifera]|uniref:Tripeptidyl-peptidase 2 n=1 Tax=Vitis vinifera TaxID=29760 RepID=A0A438G7C7_VITVI|nr:Tripeptidyl-peptidase 2 [Vitis vinifera]
MQNLIWASNPLESPFLGHPCSKLVIQSTRRLTRRRRKGGERGREWAVRAMPCSSKNTSSSSRDDNGALRAFKLSESTFLASLIPKKGIAADRFVEAHSKYDAREESNVGNAYLLSCAGCISDLRVLFLPDSGVLQVTSGDSNGCLGGASGASLVVNSSWKNPSGEWHVGYKVVYELCTDTLTSGLKILFIVSPAPDPGDGTCTWKQPFMLLAIGISLV